MLYTNLSYKEDFTMNTNKEYGQYTLSAQGIFPWVVTTYNL